MKAIANTKVSVLKAASFDNYSGEYTNEAPTYTGLPAAMAEQRRSVLDPVSGTPVVVRFHRFRIPVKHRNVDITISRDNRIKDETTGVIYGISSVKQDGHPAYSSGWIVETARVDTRNP